MCCTNWVRTSTLQRHVAKRRQTSPRLRLTAGALACSVVLCICALEAFHHWSGVLIRTTSSWRRTSSWSSTSSSPWRSCHTAYHGWALTKMSSLPSLDKQCYEHAFHDMCVRSTEPFASCRDTLMTEGEVHPHIHSACRASMRSEQTCPGPLRRDLSHTHIPTLRMCGGPRAWWMFVCMPLLSSPQSGLL